MTAEEFRNIASTIPQQPGIYKYYDAADTLMYVGKAKNLRKRVSSYFTKTFTNYKTHELVSRIARISFTIVSSEQDAFLLENSLIKQFQPLFNINLKDDKTYPYVIIKNEPFPRIFLTRTKIDDGSEYLGPFTSAGKVRDLVNFIRHHIPLRTCKLNLTQQNIKKKKFKVCLEYHLGNCKGPCEDLQTPEDYNAGLSRIRQMLKGNLQPVIIEYKREMAELSSNMEFEKAERIRKKLDHLLQYQAKSVVVSKHLNNLDVFSLYREHNIAFVNYLAVENGTIVQTHTAELTTPLDESDEEVLLFSIAQLRNKLQSDAKEIIVPFEITYPDTEVQVTVPKLGEKKKLLELSQQNVNHYREELKKKKVLNLAGKTEDEMLEILEELQASLNLTELPVNIECFDNSNFQGSNAVSAMVSFKHGLPSKKDYRHFNVKTVQGINDFATMKEVVQRRYSRLKSEGSDLPQLVIIDGGKGQLNAALEAIEELGLTGTMTLIGLAKNEEEIFFAGDVESLKLPWEGKSLKLIRRIRDEVHRFGITFHRNQRSRKTFINELEDIPGIGKTTATQLLKHFKSVKNVKSQALESLESIIGKAKARLVWENYHSPETDESKPVQ